MNKTNKPGKCLVTPLIDGLTKEIFLLRLIHNINSEIKLLEAIRTVYRISAYSPFTNARIKAKEIVLISKNRRAVSLISSNPW